jgi:uncharacterized membrane protein
MDGRPALQREWWFTQLTLFIWGWMLLAPRLQDRWLVQLLLQAFLLNAVVMTLRANPEWRALRGSMLALWGLSLAGAAVSLAPLPDGWQALAADVEAASILPLLALLAVGILRFVYRSRRLTVDGIFATMLVYMILAIAFARLYALLISWDPQSFALPVAAEERSRQLLHVDMIYYSLITQCSVGYGDILPRSDVARMVAVIQAVIGQFYMAVVVAVFVGMYAARRED